MMTVIDYFCFYVCSHRCRMTAMLFECTVYVCGSAGDYELADILMASHLPSPLVYSLISLFNHPQFWLK